MEILLLSTTLKRAKPKRATLSSAFLRLGASKDEIADLRINYSRTELLEWAQNLKIMALAKFHPDLHPEDPDKYHAVATEITSAHEDVKRILKPVSFDFTAKPKPKPKQPKGRPRKQSSYYERHKEAKKAQVKAWQKKNREKVKQYKRASYLRSKGG